MPRPRPYQHDPIKSRLHNSFRSIRQCANNPNNSCYQRAQAAGLNIKCSWQTLEEFCDYVLAKLGPPPFPQARIVRKNQNKDWRPGNIEWNTHKVQGQRYRNNVFIRWRGQRLNLKTWAEQLGIPVHTVYGRWQRGITRPEKLFRKTEQGN